LSKGQWAGKKRYVQTVGRSGEWGQTNFGMFTQPWKTNCTPIRMFSLVGGNTGCHRMGKAEKRTLKYNTTEGGKRVRTRSNERPETAMEVNLTGEGVKKRGRLHGGGRAPPATFPKRGLCKNGELQKGRSHQQKVGTKQLARGKSRKWETTKVAPKQKGPGASRSWGPSWTTGKVLTRPDREKKIGRQQAEQQTLGFT